jgi:WD40 repeat protein
VREEPDPELLERVKLFERAWKAGPCPRIEDFLGETSESERPTLLRELLAVELELRRGRCERPGPEEYRVRLPDCAALIDEVCAEAENRSHREVQTSEVPAISEAPATEDFYGTSTGGVGSEDHPTRVWSGLPQRLGDYEVIEAVGRGGMGSVYKVHDVALNRIAALKIIHHFTAADGVATDRFFRAARLWARLKHPSIVPIYHVGQFDGMPYVVSEFIEGVNLSALLSQAGRPTARDAARIIAEVADALHFAHERGVIHRDVKPSNIMIRPDGHAGLVDFGLARSLADDEASLSSTGTVIGTPPYMSPEQAEGRLGAIGPASDVYGLGATLYTLLVSRPPFQGQTVIETLRQIPEVEPVPPRRLVPTAPRDLETICLKCLEKDPKDRYASARDLAEDLNRWLEGESIQARPTPAAERLVKWARRRPVIAALTAAIAVVSILGMAGVTWGWHQAVVARNEAFKSEDLARRLAYEAFKSEDLARHLAYAAKLNLAQRQWQDANLAEMRRHLDETLPPEGKPDLRGFEWYYLDRLSRAQGPTLAGHIDYVGSVAYSRDGHYLASASEDGTIKLWDPATGQVVRTLTTGTSVHAVAFHPDGTRLASAGDDRTVTLWDAATGQPIRSLSGHTRPIYELAFSPDGKTLASSSTDGTIKLWNIAADAPVRTLQDHRADSVGGMAFSPDGKTLASTGGGELTIRLWDVAAGQLVRSFTEAGAADPDGKTLPGRQQAHAQRYCKPVAFSPDGKILATGARDGTIQLWDVAAGSMSRPPLWDDLDLNLVSALAFSPDGKTLASVRRTGQQIELWNPTTGHLRSKIKGHTGVIWDLAFSPDGTHLASACSDTMVRIWDPTRDQEARSLAEHDDVRGVAFGPDGTYLASAGRDRTVTLWDLATGQVVRVLRGHTDTVHCVAISPDGRRAASGGEDRSVRIWEVATGKELHVLQGHAASVLDLAFSPDGKILASAGDDRTVRIWDADTGREIKTLAGHIQGVTGVVFSPDGKTLASGGKDGFVLFWDLGSGRQLRSLKAHPDGVRSLAMSPDGRWLATGGFEPSIIVWEVATGREVQTLAGHAFAINDLAFSPDSRRVASASSDRTVRIWDPAFGQEVLVLRGHSGTVWAVAFSPNGARLATASEDQTLRLWEADASARLRRSLWRE